VIAVVGLGLITGLIKPKAAFAIIGTFVLGIVASPFIEAIFEVLPSWIGVVALILFILAVIRAAFELLLGARATDHVVGGLALDVIRGVFRIFFLPFRIIGWLLFRRTAVRGVR